MPTALVLLDDGFQDAEVIYPVYRLREAGYEVLLVGPEADQRITGKYGYSFTAEAAARDVKLDGVAVVVIPGGWAPDRMRTKPAFVQLVRDATQRDAVVAAICHAGQLLVEADVVGGKRLTSYVAVRRDLQNAGATWLDEPVVVDGHLVTSRTPDDLPAFMAATLEVLGQHRIVAA